MLLIRYWFLIGACRECVYPTRLFSQLLALAGWPQGWALVTPLLDAAFSAQVRLYRRTQALQLLTAAARNRALARAAPPAELKVAVSRLQSGLKQVSGATAVTAVGQRIGVTSLSPTG